MVKNFMQDITPGPDDLSDSQHSSPSTPQQPPRSIRDFKPSAARVRLQGLPRETEPRPEFDQKLSRRRPWGIWLAAIVCIVVLGGAAALFLFPSTTITITPHTHVLTFDSSMTLTAFPSANAPSGTLPYSVLTQIFEDSAVVQASGTEHADEKSTGNITIYNETAKVSRLIKNTRFQSPAGLIFRIPASVDVPAAKGGSPGSVVVTVFADQTGPDYNLGPTDKFTLPGLKTSPDYTKIYAKSTSAFTGGFSGDRPAVSQSVLDAATAEVRSRLNEKAQELFKTVPSGSVAFPGIVAIAYQSLDSTNEPGGGVRIHERATVTMPVFPLDQFSHSFAQALLPDVEGQTVSVQFSSDIAGQPVGTLDASSMGVQPIKFSLSGKGELVWQVDTGALARALAGRDYSAFQNIIKGFPAVEEAKARIAPFWQHSFPRDAGAIKLNVLPAPSQF